MHSAEINEEVQNGTGTVRLFDAKVSTELIDLPAGPLAIALGGEYRKEVLEQWHSEIFESGYIVGGAGAVPAVPATGRTVKSLFAEVDVPIVKGLDVLTAVRFDRYSDFGSTANPKSGCDGSRRGRSSCVRPGTRGFARRRFRSCISRATRGSRWGFIATPFAAW